MEIVKATENLDAKMRYRLAKDPTTEKMSKHKNEVVSFDAYMVREEVNSDAEIVKVLSMHVVPDDIIIATNSKTFIREFLDMLSCFEEVGEKVDCIEILTGISKAGREYISCRYAGE